MAIEKHLTELDQDEEDEAYELMPIRVLTYEEALSTLDLQARKMLNMSGEEFLAKWRADAFSEEFIEEHHSAFAFLSIMAIPFGE